MPFAETVLLLAAPLTLHLLTELAQTTPDPLSPLLQVGVTGAFLLIALGALRAVYQQQIADLKETVTAERTRADRTENELIKLNEAVRERLLGTMAGSAETFKEALRALEARR